MKPIPVVIYSSPDQIDAIVRQLEADAMNVPPDCEEHRKIMKMISKFRMYAEAKRWLSTPADKQHAKR